MYDYNNPFFILFVVWVEIKGTCKLDMSSQTTRENPCPSHLSISLTPHQYHHHRLCINLIGARRALLGILRLCQYSLVSVGCHQVSSHSLSPSCQRKDVYIDPVIIDHGENSNKNIPIFISPYGCLNHILDTLFLSRIMESRMESRIVTQLNIPVTHSPIPWIR